MEELIIKLINELGIPVAFAVMMYMLLVKLNGKFDRLADALGSFSTSTTTLAERVGLIERTAYDQAAVARDSQLLMREVLNITRKLEEVRVGVHAVKTEVVGVHEAVAKVQDEVRTANALNLGAAVEKLETRAIEATPEADRTASDREHLRAMEEEENKL